MEKKEKKETTKKSKRGGPRPNSGRPKKIDQEHKIEELEESEVQFRKWALKDIWAYYNAYIDLALGIKVVKPVWSNGKKVREEVYQKPPDRGALNDLTSRIMGKIKDDFGISLDVKNIKEVQDTLQQIFGAKIDE